MLTAHLWTNVSEKLPDTKTTKSIFTSEPLLFMVNGEEYSGHYHENGWFYEYKGGYGGIMAASSEAVRKNPGGFTGRTGEDRPMATHWRYLERYK